MNNQSIDLVPYLAAYRNKKTGQEHVFAAVQRTHGITAYHLVTENPGLTTEPGRLKELGTDIVESKACCIASGFQLGITRTPSGRNRSYLQPIHGERLLELKRWLTERATPPASMQDLPTHHPAHTGGTWWIKETDEDSTRVRISPYEPRGLTVYGKDHLANARLICAAPALYAALTAFTKLIAQREADLGGLSEDMAEVATKARDALAASRGEA